MEFLLKPTPIAEIATQNAVIMLAKESAQKIQVESLLASSCMH